MRNKVLSLLFAAILLASLAACGDSPQHAQTDVDPPVSDSSAIPGSPAALGVGSSSSSALGLLPQLKYQPPAAITPDPVLVEKKVLVDRDGVKITSKALDHSWFTVSVENGSDMKVDVRPAFCAANDIVFPLLGGRPVEAGETADYEMHLYGGFCDVLAWMGTVKEIEVAFSVDFVMQDSSDDGPDFISDIVSVRTTAEPGSVQQRQDEGYVLYEANGIKVVYQGMDCSPQNAPDAHLVLYVENFGETDVGIALDEVTIDGHLIFPVGVFLPAGMQAYTTTEYNATGDVYGYPVPIGYDIDTLKLTLSIFENRPGDYSDWYFNDGHSLQDLVDDHPQDLIVDGVKLCLAFA